MDEAILTDPDWAPALISGAVAFVLVVLGPIVRFGLRRRGRTAIAADIRRLSWPTQLLLAAIVGRVAAESADSSVLREVAYAVLVVTVACWCVRLMSVGQSVIFRRLDIDRTDNLRTRSRRTQIELIRRVAVVIVIVGAAAVLLLTLTPLGSIGRSIVAYAGLIGVVLGFALRSPIENLAAGVMVAFAEPIRIDDVVVVEGEWGRIEEIGLTNVTVRVWDDRRLVLPTSRFVNEPFENWTRSSASLTGVVTLWLDYTADVDDVRDAVESTLRTAELWDERFFKVQVVELGPHAMQVRVLVTAANASDLWDLRCQVREELLGYLTDSSAALPIVRVDQLERVPAV